MIQKQKLRVPWLLSCNEVVQASLVVHINRRQHGPTAVGISVMGGEEQQAEGLFWFRAKERIHSHPSVQQLYWRTRVSGNRGPAKALNSSQRRFVTCESWQSSEEGDIMSWGLCWDWFESWFQHLLHLWVSEPPWTAVSSSDTRTISISQKMLWILNKTILVSHPM